MIPVFLHFPRRTTRLSLFALFALLPVLASAADSIVTSLAATKRVVRKDAAGKPVETFVPFTKALPGDYVVYTLTYTNVGAVSASDITITLPVPPEMSLVDGSADQADVSISYSVDGGKSYGALETLAIASRDGLSRPARPEDVTNLRWIRRSALSPSEKATLSYAAVLK